ncbi:MAG TPA: alpha/beta fold hydrolase [Anaerolineales bacterium]|nr:alpha/beta fold hydrolase [Anaerolineales bacterium]
MTHFHIPKDLYHEEGYKQVNGIPHYYRMVGTGEPFVFLHGGPGMWHDELVPSFLEFAQNHKCIYYDQRGNGKSLMKSIDKTNFTTELLVDDLDALRKEFGIEKMNIIGHSWGGLLGMYYAGKYPQNVKRLILVDPAPVNTELLIKSYENMMTRFSEADWNRLQAMYESEAYIAGDPDAHNEAMRLSEGVTFHNEQAREDYFKIAVFDETTAKNAVAINDHGREMKLNITVQEQLGNIICPTLIVQGREDFIVPEAAELAHKSIRNSKLVYIADSGHYPFMEAPSEFFNTLNSFIDET